MLNICFPCWGCWLCKSKHFIPTSLRQSCCTGWGEQFTNNNEDVWPCRGLGEKDSWLLSQNLLPSSIKIFCVNSLFSTWRCTPHCVKTPGLHFLRSTQHNEAVWRRRRPPHRFLYWAEIKHLNQTLKLFVCTSQTALLYANWVPRSIWPSQCRAVASVRKVISNAKSRRSDTRLRWHRLRGGGKKR